MENVSVLITIALFIGYLAYEKYENKKTQGMLIRELTTSLKSKDIVEYKDNVPEYSEVKFVEKEQDELVPVEEIDPRDLLRAIRKS